MSRSRHNPILLLLQQLAEMLSFLTKGDKILLILSLGLGLGSMGISRFHREVGSQVCVEANGIIVAQVDLFENRQVVVAGAIGKTVVKIANGKVRVLSSACPEHICVETGNIDKVGDTIVCVPNRVVVRVVGTGKVNFDLITG